MKVLHVLCDLSGGGAERLVLELCRKAAPDVNSEVLVVQDGGALAPDFAEAGIVVHRAGRQRRTPGFGAWYRTFQQARSFDVVHTHLWAGDVWGRPAAWLARAPVRVSTEHNIDRDEAPWKRRIKRLTHPLVHRLVAVSPAGKEALIADGVAPGRIVVIENGVDLGRFAEPHQGGGGVLFVGRLAPQKGVDVLIEAARRLPEVPFVIAGEGPTIAAPSNVRFLGLRRDIPALLASADVAVVPSRWEGFGLAAVEAMAAGVPVVASAVDALPGLLGDAGALVPPEDPVALAEAIAGLLADRGAARAMGTRGRVRAERFGVESMVRRYEALWRLPGALPR